MTISYDELYKMQKFSLDNANLFRIKEVVVKQIVSSEPCYNGHEPCLITELKYQDLKYFFLSTLNRIFTKIHYIWSCEQTIGFNDNRN